ncbi:MAG: endonuclease/exonuclease/phosphatase family protein [Deltaproteobacteria bacterium]|nr:endonuclease/exonuclease/phosphatase family protein [Deltaproteobacteria bacterium]
MVKPPARFKLYAWIIAVAALVISISNARAETKPSRVFKVLELNFNSEIVPFDDRDEKMRDLRFAAIVEYIKRESIDVVLIAEGWNYKGYPSLAIPLAEALDYDYHYRLVEGFPGLLYDSNVILSKKDYWMGGRHKIKLPHTAWALGDEIHTIIPLGKRSVAVGARLILPNGEPLYVYATHLLGDTDKDRTDQVAALNHAVKKISARDGVDWRYANVLVGGDLNSGPDSPEMRYFGQNGYLDTWAAAHPDHFNDVISATSCNSPYSWHYNPINLGAGMLPTQDTIGTNGRIDYVFARGNRIRVLASTVMFTHPYNGFWMSDHYGVLTTLALDDAQVAAPPNPLTDSDDVVPALTKVLEVTDSHFAPCEKEIDCDLELPAQGLIAMRGIAVVNKSGDKIHVKISGPARALPSPSSSLDAGHASSFVFTQPGNYDLVVHDVVGDSLHATLRVR